MTTQHQTDLLDADYAARVLKAVKAARAGGASTLTAICRRSHGAFPVAVHEVLNTLPGGEDVPHRAWRDEEPGMVDSAIPAMPEPHPVDYEWRYSASTADALADHLMESGSRIACLGTPSVFWRLRHRQADAVLIDRNVELVKSLGLGDRDQLLITDLLRVDKEDLRGELKRGFDVVLLDPPWYVDHTLSWISCALAILRPGGKLILTLFPELVRPTALEEREHLKKVLESFGAIQSLPFDAFYSTPTFEHETLGAFGLADLGQWRSGSLISLTVSKPGKPLSVPFPPEAKWKRVRLGSQVVAVRSSNDETRAALPLRFSPPESDGSFLLKSVSARDPVRRGITVWTSRNRALIASQGEGHVLPFLQKLEKGQKPVEALAGSDPLSRDELRLLSGLVGW